MLIGGGCALYGYWFGRTVPAARLGYLLIGCAAVVYADRGAARRSAERGHRRRS
jgi:uncharacterized membrane protein YuzA (DUF378 family)